MNAAIAAKRLRFAALAGHLTFIERMEADIPRGKIRREGFQTAGLKAGSEAEIPRLEKRRAFELNHLGATVPLANDTKSRSSGRPAGHDPPATN